MGSIPPGHYHIYGEWFNSGTCQRRQCKCGQTETRDNNWGSWEIDHYYQGRKSKPSVKKRRTCSNCGVEQTKGGW